MLRKEGFVKRIDISLKLSLEQSIIIGLLSVLKERLLCALILFMHLLKLSELAFHQFTGGKAATASSHFPCATSHTTKVIIDRGAALNLQSAYPTMFCGDW